MGVFRLPHSGYPRGCLPAGTFWDGGDILDESGRNGSRAARGPVWRPGSAVAESYLD